jgi:probable HAF family extracellular repeat protein
MKNIIQPTLSALALALFMAPALAAPSYQATLLTSVTVGDAPISMNESGDFIASSRDSLGNVGLKLYQGGGPGQFLPTAPGSDYSQGIKINNQGQVLGVDYRSTSIGLSNESPYLYSQGVRTSLEALGGTHSYAMDINDRGDVAGISSSTEGGPYQAFVHSGGQVHLLGNLGGPLVSSVQINNQGQVAGVSQAPVPGSAGVKDEVFFYSDGQMRSLGDFGNASNRVAGLNDRGQFVVTGDAGVFLVDGDAVTQLGRRFIDPTDTIHYGGFEGLAGALAMNELGTVVGHTLSHAGSAVAIFKDGATWELNTLLGPNSGVFITEISAIDDRDRMLVRDSLDRVFLLTPTAAVPEPGTWVLMLAGLLGMTAVTRRRP